MLQDLVKDDENHNVEDEGGYVDELAQLNNSRVTMGGILSNVTKRLTKSNTTMATARIEDLYGSIEIVVFPKNYENLKESLVDDAMVKIKGVLTVEQGFAPKIRVEEIAEWKSGDIKEQPKEKQKQTKLYINLKDESKYDELMTILEGYEGQLSVVLVKGGKGYSLPCKVRECRALHIELDDLIGEENVKLVEK